jgi:hypothetical protein
MLLWLGLLAGVGLVVGGSLFLLRAIAKPIIDSASCLGLPTTSARVLVPMRIPSHHVGTDSRAEGVVAWRA